jgi:hypothetical protein
MSAIPPKADIRRRDLHVRFVPKADMTADRRTVSPPTLHSDAPLAEYSVRLWKNSRSRGERPSCGNSAYVVCPPLGFGLNDSLWFRWQLKNGSLLTLTQRC